jgi:zinc transport system substrate-binding protein
MGYKLFLGFALFLLSGCTKQDAPVSAKPQILVSIAPYRFIVEQIAGPDFEVRTIVPQNADPHSFEPTSRQVTELTRGEVWFLIGESFEKKILPVLQDRNSKLKAVDLADGIDLIAEGCCNRNHMDRHIWMSPKDTAVQADTITKALCDAFPQDAELFQKNNNELKQKLAQLDTEIRTMLEPVETRAVIVSHPAFAYFCRDYQFEQISVECEGKDPRPKHLEQIMQKTAKIGLCLPQYNNKGTQLIAEKMDIPVEYIDPYSDDYFNTMRKLARSICTTK